MYFVRTMQDFVWCYTWRSLDFKGWISHTEQAGREPETGGLMMQSRRRFLFHYFCLTELSYGLGTVGSWYWVKSLDWILTDTQREPKTHNIKIDSSSRVDFDPVLKRRKAVILWRKATSQRNGDLVCTELQIRVHSRLLQIRVHRPADSCAQ